MNWKEVCEDPILQDLPYKIELNEWGQIIMSPATNKHSIFQGIIIKLLNKITEEGSVFPECSIETSKGVKVADVVWCSDDFIKIHGIQTPYSVSPEICVEVISPSNSKAEINQKIELYLAKGAKEVWVCDLSGNVKFYSHIGEIKKSKIFPKFPRKIESNYH
jgi:Uma2 family endonuclease